MKKLLAGLVLSISLTACANIEVTFEYPIGGPDTAYSTWNETNRERKELVWGLKQGFSDAGFEVTDEYDLDMPNNRDTVLTARSRDKAGTPNLTAEAHIRSSSAIFSEVSNTVTTSVTGAVNERELEEVLEKIRKGYHSYLEDTY